MKKARYGESQITMVLKEREGLRTVKTVCREYGAAAVVARWTTAIYIGRLGADAKLLLLTA